ncbi:MAG: PAS domain-containing protein [Anaerolineae bacterium]|nr:PAS domain-containing protein [Anaerolineae bacterium]
MVGFSVPVAVIGGITAYVGLYHLLLYLRRKTYREGLAFALLCFAMVAYDCLAVGLYNASSLAEGHLWQRLQESSLALTVVAFLWFFKVYCACAHLKKWPVIVSLYLVSSAVFCLLDQSGLAWLRDRSAIREILLPWGEPIVYYGVLRGPLIHLQDIVGTLTFAYLTWIAIKLYQSSHAERIRPLLGVMVFMSIGILNDLALSVSSYRFIYLLEYTNFAVVLLMTYSLSGEVMQMQQALQGSQQMLQSIMDNLPQAIFWKGYDLTFLGCNREFAADAGLERSEDIVGKSDFDMPWAELAEQYRLDDLQVLQTGNAKLDYEEPQVTLEGHQVWMRTSKVPLRDASDNVIAVLGIYQDITEQKHILEVLKHSEERYRLLFQRSPVGIFHYDHSLHITALNARFAEIMRSHRGQLMGVDLKTLGDPVLLPALSAALRGEMGNYEGPYHTLRDAGPVFISMRTAPYYNEKRETRGGIAIVEDITERKRAEETLRERAARLELIADIGQRTTAILALDELLHQAVALINDTFHYYNVAILFVEGDELVVRAVSPPIFMPFEGKVRLRMGSQGITGWVATHGEPLIVPDVSAEPRYYRISEEMKTRSELAVPIKLQDEMIGVLTAESTELNAFSESDTFTLQTIADQLATAIGNARLYEAAQQEIYRRQEVEAEIRQLNEALEQRVRERTAQLEAINKELSVFAYSVSHDLRAPLRSIDGFSQALLEDYGERLDAQGQDYLRRVRLASQRMGQLIDDLLNLSRLTRSEMHYKEVDLSALAREVATRLQESQLQREVAWVIADGMSARGDAHLLGIMLENLLSNAWKFTGKQPHPRIEVGTLDVEGSVTYFVRDNGAGFDMAYADKLFQAFQRLHQADEFEGTGVGLATVQRIVHRHGGRIWAEGEVGKGATFYFTL